MNTIISKVLQRFKRGIAFTMIAVLLISSMGMYVEASDDDELIEFVEVMDDEAGTHIHEGKTFQPWSVSNNLPDKAGNYYLENDVDLESTWVTADGEISICLNGYSILSDIEDYAIKIGNNSMLNIYDCSETKGIVGGEDCLSVFDVLGKLNIYEGMINATGVAVRIDMLSDVGGELNQYGGKITGGSGVVVSKNSKYSMYGGIVESNANNSVGLYNNGIVHIYNGEIIGSSIGRGAIDCKGTELIIEDGVFRGIDNNCIIGQEGIITISGGSFTGPILQQGAEISISGGYYSNILDQALIADGYEIAKHNDEDLPYKVREAYKRLNSVSINGNTLYGEKLHATVQPNIVENVQYQWFRDGVRIEEADKNIYTLSSNDIDHSVSVCAVQTINDEVDEIITVYSEPTEMVQKGRTLIAPDFSVYNNFYDKDGSVIVTLSGNDASRRIEFEYRSEDSEIWNSIDGIYEVETNGSILLEGFLAGHFEFACRYAESDVYQASEWEKFSVELGYTENNIDINAVSIIGLPNYGQTLTAIIEPEDANRITYQWYRDDTAISGAIQKEYIISKEDISHKIKVLAKQRFGTVSNNVMSESTEVIKKALGPNAPIILSIVASEIEAGSLDLSLGEDKAGEKLQLQCRYSGKDWQLLANELVVDEVGVLHLSGLREEGVVKIGLRYVETEYREASAWRTVEYTFTKKSSGDSIVVGDFKIWATEGGTLTKDKDYTVAYYKGRTALQILSDKPITIAMKDGLISTDWTIEGPYQSAIKDKYNKTNTMNITLKDVIIDRSNSNNEDYLKGINATNCSLNLWLEGTNKVKGGAKNPRKTEDGWGIFCGGPTSLANYNPIPDGTFTLNGEGSITVESFYIGLLLHNPVFYGGCIRTTDNQANGWPFGGPTIVGGCYASGSIEKQQIFGYAVEEGYEVIKSNNPEFPFKVVKRDGFEPEIKKERVINKLLIENKNVAIGVNEEKAVAVTALTSDAETRVDLIWKSSNENVVTVSEHGVVKGIFPGKAKITAIAVEDPKKTISCTVKVGGEIDSVSIKQKKNLHDVEAGKTVKLSAVITTKNGIKAINKKLIWESSDSSIATVSDKGVVSGIKESDEPVLITARPEAYPSIYATYEIKVCRASKANIIDDKNGITIVQGKNKYNEGDIIEIANGKSIKLLGYNKAGKKYTSKDIAFYSDNEKIVSCAISGKIKGLDEGMTTITAVSLQNPSCKTYIKIRCYNPVKKITLNSKSIKMDNGQRGVIAVSQFTPINATNGKIQWTATDIKGKRGIKAVNGIAVLAAVLPEGKDPEELDESEFKDIRINPIVTEKNEKLAFLCINESKRCVITAQSLDGGKKANAKINIAGEMTRLALRTDNGIKDMGGGNYQVTLSPGSSIKLKPVFVGSNTATRGLIWKSCNPDMAIVTNGNVSIKSSATKSRTATIRVCTADYKFVISLEIKVR